MSAPTYAARMFARTRNTRLDPTRRLIAWAVALLLDEGGDVPDGYPAAAVSVFEIGNVTGLSPTVVADKVKVLAAKDLVEPHDLGGRYPFYGPGPQLRHEHPSEADGIAHLLNQTRSSEYVSDEHGQWVER